MGKAPLVLRCKLLSHRFWCHAHILPYMAPTGANLKTVALEGTGSTAQPEPVSTACAVQLVQPFIRQNGSGLVYCHGLSHLPPGPRGFNHCQVLP